MLIETVFSPTRGMAWRVLIAGMRPRDRWSMVFVAIVLPALGALAGGWYQTLCVAVAAGTLISVLGAGLRSPFGADVHVRLDDTGCTMRSGGWTTSVTWPAVQSVTYSRGLWIVKFASYMVMPLPEAALTEQQAADLRRFLAGPITTTDPHLY